MAEAKEQRWSCGCHEVDGVLVVQCTQVKPQTELLAHHTLNSPYSKDCFRKRALGGEAAEEAPEPEATPEPEGPETPTDETPLGDVEHEDLTDHP